MGLIKDIIREYSKNMDCIYVFPNFISQRMTTQIALDLVELPTISSENFITWKSFLATHTPIKKGNPTEVNSIIKLLFAKYEISKHIKSLQNGKPYFNSLLPTISNENISKFDTWLSSILGDLKYLLHVGANKKDAILEDLESLTKDYVQFLKDHNLFESGFFKCNVSIEDEKQYTIIYPELIDNFTEYQSFLQQNHNIKYIHVPTHYDTKHELMEFENTRLEIKYIASQIEELLLTKKAKTSDVALCVVDIEQMEPYIRAEFDIRGIPLDFYVQKPYIRTTRGTFFNRIKDVKESRYSFEAIKKLLLQPSILWKNKKDIDTLLQFGIDHNCAISWQDANKKWHNPWEEAFVSLSSLSEKEQNLKHFFSKLKEGIETIYSSPSFEELEDNINTFLALHIEKFFDDENKIKKERERYKKIVKDLKKIERLFDSYFNEAKINRYTFFISALEHSMFSPDVIGGGVSVFPYNAASAIPFKAPFVLNMNQQDSSITRTPLPFLQDDKKEKMKIFNVELTQYFLNAYANLENIQFSYSKKTYKGYTIAQSNFKSKKEIKSHHSEDSYHIETQSFVGKINISKKIYTKQFASLLSSRKFMVNSSSSHISTSYKKDEKYSFLSDPRICKKIKDVQFENNLIKISATDLNLFFSDCPTKFFLFKLLDLQDINFEALLFEPRMEGIIYHDMLKHVYTTIKNTWHRFERKKLEHGNGNEYERITLLAFEEVCERYTKWYGPLFGLFIKAMQKKILQIVNYVFSFDVANFDTYEQYVIEERQEWIEDDICYLGKMDRVVKNFDNIAILDYKKGDARDSKGNIINSYEEKNGVLNDFQIPFYVFLLEKLNNKRVSDAYFLNLSKNKHTQILSSADIKGKKIKTREEFEDVISTLKKCINEFKQKILQCDFKVMAQNKNICKSCKYKYICRTSFNIKTN